MPGRGYIGRAGHLAAMSEFLLRGYNVAIPEVDVGDDIFVVHDQLGTLWRIQVKTARGEEREYGYSGQFLVPLKQLERALQPDLFYVLALRKSTQWDFVVIPLKDLRKEYEAFGVGPRLGDSLRLYLAFKETEVICSGRDYQRYRNNWSAWPIIEP
jgi:hypothetical protein